MRRVVYSPCAQRLVYVQEKGTPAFRGERWRAEGKPATVTRDGQ